MENNYGWSSLQESMGRFNLDDTGGGVVHDDRISSLPDEILLSIISSLSVEEIASLSLVSRHWRRLTQHDFFRHESRNSYYMEPRRFPGAFIMGHRLQRALADAEELVIEKFFRYDSRSSYCLEPEPRNSYCLEPLRYPGYDLIRRGGPFAIEKGHGPEQHGRFSRIPDLVFRIKTLRVLSIKNYDLASEFLRVIRCTHLQTLKVESGFICYGTVNAILASCHRLETLHLVDCSQLSDYEIHSGSLKNLFLRPADCTWKRYSIQAPNLEVLNLHVDKSFRALNIQPAPKIREMLLYVITVINHHGKITGFAEFLREAKELASLELNGDTVRIVAAEYAELEGWDFSLEKMGLLNVSLSIRNKPEALLLVNLLEKCPRLSQLNLKAVEYQLAPEVKQTDCSMLRRRLQNVECFCRLQSVKLDWQSHTPCNEVLLRAIFMGATMLKRLQLILPYWLLDQTVESLLSLKAPQKMEWYINQKRRRVIKVEF